MSEGQIILIALCAPSALLITFFVLIELYDNIKNRFNVAIVLVLAWMAALAERMDRRWQRAKEEIE